MLKVGKKLKIKKQLQPQAQISNIILREPVENEID